MSRVINIKGQVVIQNISLAQEAIEESGFDITIENSKFIFNQYDYHDGQYKEQEIEKVENLYTQKFNIYLEQVAEEERLKLEEEKRVIREEKASTVIKNAEKQGYKVKKEIQKNNTIKLVLEKRVY